MSENEDTVNQEAELLRTKWLGPSGHLHPAAGLIEKREQPFLARLYLLGILSTRGTAAIDAIENPPKDDNGKDKKVETIDDVLADLPTIYAKVFLSHSGSIKGFRSNQFAKIGSSVRSGVTVEGPKRSVWDKLRGKGKDNEV
jgi:hypothetical protein